MKSLAEQFVAAHKKQIIVYKTAAQQAQSAQHDEPQQLQVDLTKNKEQEQAKQPESAQQSAAEGAAVEQASSTSAHANTNTTWSDRAMKEATT